MLGIILAIRDEDDRSYVELIYIKYGKKLYLTANNILNHHEDAEDCVVKVIEAIIEHLEIYRALKHEQQIKFLVKCCRNIAINRYYEKKRQKKYERSLDDIKEEFGFEVIDEDAYVDRIVINEENVKRLTEMIDELDPIYGDLLFFKGVMHIRTSEIAKMLGISEGLVSMRLTRARRILLKKRGDELNDIRIER